MKKGPFRNYGAPGTWISSFDAATGRGLLLAGTPLILLAESTVDVKGTHAVVTGHATVLRDTVSNSQ